MPRLFAAFCCLTLFAAPMYAAAPSNILVILADDCTYNDLPVYGGRNAHTPNIDELASESLVFNQAYLAEAMCQPCRAELYSGLYPMRNGCAWNHSASLNEIQSMPDYLGNSVIVSASLVKCMSNLTKRSHLSPSVGTTQTAFVIRRWHMISARRKSS